MDLESLMKRQNEFEETIRQVMQTMVEVANSHQRTSAILETLAERQVNTEETLNILAERQVDTEEALDRFERSTDEAINRLAQKQAITQENLNVLLLTVERHIEGHKQ